VAEYLCGTMTSVRFFGAAVATLDGRSNGALSIVPDDARMLLPNDEDWRNPSVDRDGTAAWLQRSLCAQTGELMEVV
jgi:hypothetical protein